ncbi:hypothetical protein AB0M02_23710 [Actinoplanes sp. NPDC051861]|uniref:hypothetical protein n=1 Tax=Actinoplanes sp. NPDC051861 TaxID=3155170 RepID=UPI003435C344
MVEDDDVDDVSAVNLEELEGRVMGAAVRHANSASLAWPYAAESHDSADFAVRRAIVQAAGGARFTIEEPIFGNADPEYSLLMVRSAIKVKESAEKTLNQLVAEAKRAGATWQDIGDAMGTGKTAAQKRFGASVPSNRDLEVEILRGAMARGAIAGWSGFLDPPEDEEGDPSPMYMLYFSFQRLLRLFMQIEDYGAKVSEIIEEYDLDYRKGLDVGMRDKLVSIYVSLRDACRLLVREDVMRSAQIDLDDGRGGASDLSVHVHLCKATVDALIARRYLEIALKNFYRDLEPFADSLIEAGRSMQSCAQILFLPQCQQFLGVIKQTLMDNDEWFESEKTSHEDPDVIAERSQRLWRAYYRNDEQALKEIAEELKLWRNRGEESA